MAAIIHQMIDYNSAGQPAMAYVEAVAARPEVGSSFAAFHFTKGRALPGEPGTDLPVALVTFNGAGPLAGIVQNADGVSSTMRSGPVFVKNTAWSGNAGRADLTGNDTVMQFGSAIGVDFTDTVQVRAEQVRATESRGFLGAIGTGGFSTSGGATLQLTGLSLRLHGTTRFGRLGLFATYRQGTARSAYANSLLSRIDAKLTQAASGVWWQDGRNAAALVVSQPLGITGGDMSLKLASGRTDAGAVTYNTPTVNLTGIRQVNVEAGFTHYINNQVKVGLNLIYVQHPSNQPGLNHDAGAMLLMGARL
ncbi:hypothetical protein A9404_04020 [Halothiobacillus diazotrophicus]|uniref:Porin domain-containing protein n=1 Tax=Halothiobacillus diazotrophicus TaxID=1860122 RepID=A0A191ZFJ6_9GAMM|nr:hypothetical protein [Halothiobacillus diazotrophicus]ANJ66654.1 hypothetical protein A9404_04020 [Halothiobacillus diazotrophicus]